jgi:hypothetical protein
MATRRKPALQPAGELAPAAGRGEHWRPVAAAILVAAGLHVAAASYRSGPSGWCRAVPGGLVVVLLAGNPGRPHRPAENLAAGDHRDRRRVPHPWPTCSLPAGSWRTS